MKKFPSLSSSLVDPNHRPDSQRGAIESSRAPRDYLVAHLEKGHFGAGNQKGGVVERNKG